MGSYRDYIGVRQGNFPVWELLGHVMGIWWRFDLMDTSLKLLVFGSVGCGFRRFGV